MSSDEPPATSAPRDLEGDPVALRALAHPLRIRLLEELTLRGPMTATEASARVGESPSACSFHLRTLAKYGFLEEAEGGTGRNRPWRVVTIGNRWATTSETPAAERAAGDALGAVVRHRDHQLLEEHLARIDELEDEWRRAAFSSNYGGWMTAAELDEISEGITRLWEPYLARFGDDAEVPEGARLVHMFVYGFPRADFLDDQPPARTHREDDDRDGTDDA